MKTIDNLGKIILKLRKEQHISRRKLSENLCSIKHLERIEKGQSAASIFLLECILERLGERSSRYLYTFSNMSDNIIYEKIHALKQKMDISIDQTFKEMFIQFEQYVVEKKENNDKKDEISKNFLQQFMLMCKAEILINIDQDIDKARKICLEAIRITIPHFSISHIEHLDRTILLTDEINILTLLGRCYYLRKERRLAYEILFKLKINIENKYINNALENCIYPFVLYNLSNVLLIMNRYEEAIEICHIGINSCVERKTLCRMSQLHFNRACAWLELKKEEQAEEDFEVALTLSKLIKDIEFYREIQKKWTLAKSQ